MLPVGREVDWAGGSGVGPGAKGWADHTARFSLSALLGLGHGFAKDPGSAVHMDLPASFGSLNLVTDQTLLSTDPCH